MNALQIKKSSSESAPELSLTNLAKPTVKDGFVLVEVHAAPIWPSDRLNAKGGFGNTTFPRVPGRDFAGIIVDGPSDRIGQEVFGTGGDSLGFVIDGSHAEYCLVPSDAAVRKPKNLSFVQAANVGVPYSTALLTLRRARATKDDVVLVLGATGAVGSAAVQIAKAIGCARVLSASRHDTADVNIALDPNLTSLEKLTNGKGVDVVVDTVGDLALMEAAINKLAYDGRYSFISAPRGQGASTVLPFDIFKGYRNGTQLIGSNSVEQTPKEVGSYMSDLQTWFETGALSAKPESALTTYSLENATQAYQDLAQKGAVIRIK